MSESDIPCRLCAAPSTYSFHLKLMGRYDVAYFTCTACRSLQTEVPYWLDDAYADARRPLDVYSATRVEQLRGVTQLVSRLFGWKTTDTLLDWGAGDGLLVRMLRDVGIDAYAYDIYTPNQYAVGFDAEPAPGNRMITAFELWEHLPDPAAELDRIFALQPDIHLLTTGLYSGQGADWYYLVPQTGRHVFLYSAEAMEWIAKKYDYQVLTAPLCSIFYRGKLNGPRKAILKRLITLRSRKMFECIRLFTPHASLIQEDRNFILLKMGKDHPDQD
ncbi:MAG: hypothetical protein ACI9TH_005249 [Kiritimatiellia bacterium]|jgi:hypothetical protein